MRKADEKADGLQERKQKKQHVDKKQEVEQGEKEDEKEEEQEKAKVENKENHDHKDALALAASTGSSTPTILVTQAHGEKGTRKDETCNEQADAHTLQGLTGEDSGQTHGLESGSQNGTTPLHCEEEVDTNAGSPAEKHVQTLRSDTGGACGVEDNPSNHDLEERVVQNSAGTGDESFVSEARGELAVGEPLPSNSAGTGDTSGTVHTAPCITQGKEVTQSQVDTPAGSAGADNNVPSSIVGRAEAPTADTRRRRNKKGKR